ncbi:MAG: hypothetical protein IBJ18_05220 [Phycisphaerales bacterium]|nr:hypothetical protein [Phycisphaerales bacterium]
MRINDLVSQSLGISPGQAAAASGSERRRTRAATNQGDGSGGQGRSWLSTPRVNNAEKNTQSPAVVTQRQPVKDTAEISNLKPSRRLKNKDVAPVDESTDTQPTDETTPAQSGNTIGAVVDEFLRERTVMSYTLPIRTASGTGSFTMTYEVERAYRVIRFIEPGQQIDTEA